MSERNFKTALQMAIRGRVITPEDADYEEARKVWNRTYDRHPGALVRCLDTDDVVAAVKYLRQAGIDFCVRGGGHSYGGHSIIDDGVVIDLHDMNAVDVDVESRIVSVQGGALLGDVDRATDPHGLVVPAGLVGHTGVAGLTLGGGTGWLSRPMGLTCDSVLRMEVVTAAGEVVSASSTENADLFWALRGGGGNFGIVTKFVFQARPRPDMHAGWLYYDVPDSAVVLGYLNELVESGDRNLTVYAYLGVEVGNAEVPVQTESGRVLALRIAYAGSSTERDAALKPLRSIAPVLGDNVRPRDFLEMQQEFDKVLAHGPEWYMFADHSRRLNDRLIDELIELGAEKPNIHLADDGSIITTAVMVVMTLGGAISDVPEEDTAYPGRRAGFGYALEAGGIGQEWAELRPWARAAYARLSPHGDMDSSYLNMYSESDTRNRLRDVYGPEKYDKLREIKRKWDPQNLLSHNANIPPAD